MSRVPGFNYTRKHFKSADELAAHLANYQPAAWIGGITLHHTIAPTPAQWRGVETLDGVARFYLQTRHWSVGPHLFLAPDGIWEMTPINTPGIHAGACNGVAGKAHSGRIGIEHCGNYDRAFWPPWLEAMSISTQAVLCKWARLSPASIVGHQDCLRNKTCPGTAVERKLPYIRDMVARLLGAPAPELPAVAREYQVTATAGLNVRQYARAGNTPILRALAYQAKFMATERLPVDTDGRPLPAGSAAGWLRLVGGGYVWSQYTKSAA